MRCQIQLVAFAFCMIILISSGVASYQCGILGDRVICRDVELKIDEPIEYGSTIEEIRLINVTGSFGVKTLSSYPEVEELLFSSSNISDLEEGALCSLPKLKRLTVDSDSFPVLTKEHLSGCQNLEYFKSRVQLEEDALQYMTGLKTLVYPRPYLNFNKAYIRPLKQLTSFEVGIGIMQKVESGLFCVPTLENLRIDIYAPFELRESFFRGCDNLKTAYIKGHQAVVWEGENLFRNLPNLETLTFVKVHIIHLTKDFLSGLPNLKKFEVRSKIQRKVVVDNDTFVNVPNLLNLELSGMELEDSDMEKLDVPPKIETFWINNNELKDISVIKSLPKLQVLSLSNNKIMRFDLVNLKKNFPELKTIYLIDNPLDPEFEKELLDDKKIWIITKEDQLEEERL